MSAYVYFLIACFGVGLWTIELSIPILLRFAIMKRPIHHGYALIFLFLYPMFLFSIFFYLSRGLVVDVTQPILVGIVSYIILIGRKNQERRKDNETRPFPGYY